MCVICVFLITRQTDKMVSGGHITTPHSLDLSYCLCAVSLLWSYCWVNVTNTATEQIRCSLTRIRFSE